MADGMMIEVQARMRWFVRPGIWLAAAMLHGGQFMINAIAERGFKFRVGRGRWMIGKLSGSKMRILLRRQGIDK